MRGLDVEVPRAADDLAACGLAHHERHRMLVLAHGQRRINVSRRAFGCRNGRVPQAPKLAVGSRSPKPLEMLQRERLQHDVLTAKDDRFDEADGFLLIDWPSARNAT